MSMIPLLVFEPTAETWISWQSHGTVKRTLMLAARVPGTWMVWVKRFPSILIPFLVETLHAASGRLVGRDAARSVCMQCQKPGSGDVFLVQTAIIGRSDGE